ATGYTPKTILCVPLIDGDRIIGALEMMDKRDAQSFAPSDMEALGLFAGQAAVAIEQSFTTRNISDLLVAALGAWEAGADERRRAELCSPARGVAALRPGAESGRAGAGNCPLRRVRAETVRDHPARRRRAPTVAAGARRVWHGAMSLARDSLGYRSRFTADSV